MTRGCHGHDVFRCYVTVYNICVKHCNVIGSYATPPIRGVMCGLPGANTVTAGYRRTFAGVVHACAAVEMMWDRVRTIT